MKNLLCALCFIAIGLMNFGCSSGGQDDDNPPPASECQQASFKLDGQEICLSGFGISTILQNWEINGSTFSDIEVITISLTNAFENTNLEESRNLQFLISDTNNDGDYDTYGFSYNSVNITSGQVNCTIGGEGDVLQMNFTNTSGNRIAANFTASNFSETFPQGCASQITEGQFDIQIQ